MLDCTATAREKSVIGTRFGNSAWPAGIAKARAVPNKTITANTGQTFLEPRQCEGEQQQRAEQFEREAAGQDARAIAPVRHLPRRQHQQHERQELRQADQAEVERVARDRVDLPADRDGLHLHGDGHRDARRQVAREIAVREQAAERQACCFRLRHARGQRPTSSRNMRRSGSAAPHSNWSPTVKAVT